MTVPELAPFAAVSPGYVVPPHPPPAAPARCSFPPPAGGFGRSDSASDASPPAATPTQQITCLKSHNKEPVECFDLFCLTSVCCLLF